MSEITSPSLMNPHPYPHSFTQPEKTMYDHHFNYLVTNVEDDISVYKDKYTQIVGISPNIMKFKEKNLIYVKIQNDMKSIHNIDNIKELSKYGLELRLSSQQLDQNAVFCLGIPAEFVKMKKDKLISNLNKNHPELKIMDTYILPLKSIDQKITSIKISFATQSMVNVAIKKGIKLMDHFINVQNINRAKILGTPQCMRCYSFNHHIQKCTNKQKCLHCAEEHIYKECPNKTKKSTCANCSGGHKSISNRCPIRKKYLIVPKLDSDPEVKIVKNPESSFKEINGPIINNKNDPLKVNNPNVSYNDCLNMALKFNNWTKAYIEFQKSFGLPIIEIPDSIINDLKSEFVTNSQPINNAQTSSPIPDPPPQNTVVFKPLPTDSGNKPSPKTRHQKSEHKKNNKTQNKCPINGNPVRESFNNDEPGEILTNLRNNYTLIDYQKKKRNEK